MCPPASPLLRSRTLDRLFGRDMAPEHLSAAVGSEVEFRRLEAQQGRIQKQIDRFSARDRLDREELHER